MTLPDSLALPHDPGMIDPEPIKARFDAMFGYGWQGALADALDVRRATISDQFRLGAVQPYILAHLEWLERTPVGKWPERWNRLADLHRAKVKKDAAA